MDKIIGEDEDWVANPRAAEPKEFVGFVCDTKDTWDCVTEEDINNKLKTSEKSFETVLNRENTFGVCEHDVQAVTCHCEKMENLFLCFKCGKIFCSNPCFTSNLESVKYRPDEKKFIGKVVHEFQPLRTKLNWQSVQDVSSEKKFPERHNREFLHPKSKLKLQSQQSRSSERNFLAKGTRAFEPLPKQNFETYESEQSVVGNNMSREGVTQAFQPLSEPKMKTESDDMQPTTYVGSAFARFEPALPDHKASSEVTSQSTRYVKPVPRFMKRTTSFVMPLINSNSLSTREMSSSGIRMLQSAYGSLSDRNLNDIPTHEYEHPNSQMQFQIKNFTPRGNDYEEKRISEANKTPKEKMESKYKQAASSGTTTYTGQSTHGFRQPQKPRIKCQVAQPLTSNVEKCSNVDSLDPNGKSKLNKEGYFSQYEFLHPEERTVEICAAEKDVYFPQGATWKVVTAHVNDLNDFYVMREQDVTVVEKLSEDISRQGTFGLDGYHPKRNQTPVCCTMVDADTWARVKIVKIEGKNCHIRFIDHGNKAVVPALELRSLPGWALKIPQMTYRCALGVNPKQFEFNGEIQACGDRWADSINESLARLGKYDTAAERNGSKGVEARCLFTIDDLNYIDIKLLSRGMSWPKMLVDGDVAVWMAPQFEEDSRRAETSSLVNKLDRLGL